MYKHLPFSLSDRLLTGITDPYQCNEASDVVCHTVIRGRDEFLSSNDPEVH